MPPESRVGFVGLGAMGTPMSRRLVEAGIAVTGYDPDEGARERARANGVDLSDAAAGVAAGADAVITMLPSSDVVEKVVLGAGLADAMAAGTRLVDMSSSEPTRTRELARTLEDRGLALVDAPVSGGVGGAESGGLTIMVGGADADVAAVSGYLEPLGRVVRVGAVGHGHAVKALNNLLSATHLLATAEAMTAGERFGIDAETLLAVLNTSSGRSGSTEAKWPKFVLPGTFDSGFALSLMVKDMRIAVALADGLNSPMSLGRDATELWSLAGGALGASADHTEIARWVDALDESPDSPSPGSAPDRS